MIWSDIPNKIAGHYDLGGVATRLGNKMEIFVPLIFAWLFYIGLTAIERSPKAWNTGVKVTEENKERVHKDIRNMISTLKLILVAVFVSIAINSSLSTSLPAWFTPGYIILIFGSLIFFIIKLVKTSK